MKNYPSVMLLLNKEPRSFINFPELLMQLHQALPLPIQSLKAISSNNSDDDTFANMLEIPDDHFIL